MELFYGLLFNIVAIAALMVNGEPDIPMVAFMCNKPAMYMSEKGWKQDIDTDCIKTSQGILDYCKKMYPKLDVMNVVPSEQVTIENWCGKNVKKCHKHKKHTVTPYRCLVGPFQSDALLVPEHCIFDHKHGKTCMDYDSWNDTATRACDKQGDNPGDMRLETFAILQPCEVGKFNGVEFVCCPKSQKKEVSDTIIPVPIDHERDDIEDPEDLSVLLPKASTPKPEVETPKKEDLYEHYLKVAHDDKFENEHQYFLKAKEELQRVQHQKVTKMMKEWATARQRVQDMKDIDPKGADKLNEEITGRFQKTYEALEQEGMAEKKQLTALHQQRVQSALNDKKRKAMEHYMNVITDDKAETSEVLKALKHYIKNEEKDRLHTLNHYMHVRDAEKDVTERKIIRQQSLDHLNIISQRITQAIDMLNRLPEVQKKIKSEIEEFLQTFHEVDAAIQRELVNDKVEETPKEEELIQKYKDEQKYADNKINVETSPEKTPLYEAKEETPETEKKDYDKYYDKDTESREDESIVPHYVPQSNDVAHMSENELSLSQQEDPRSSKSHMSRSNSIYPGTTFGITVGAIAVFVIMVVGIIVLRKKTNRGPTTEFVEVDQSASPEERHVANMQMNGYENPTYRYFETSTPAQA